MVNLSWKDRMNTIRLIGVLAAALLLAGCAGRTSTQSRSIHNLLPQVTAERGQDEANMWLVNDFRQLAMSRDWMESLRVFDISEAEFIALPAAERDARREGDLATASRMQALASAVMRQADREQKQGNLTEAKALREAVRRLVVANSGQETLALADLVAQSINRSLPASARN